MKPTPKIVQPQAIEIGQYWECVKENRDQSNNVAFKPGDLLIVTELDAQNVHVYSGDNPESPSWTIGYDEFDSHFRFAPDGAARRAQLMAELNASLFADQQKLIDQQQAVAHMPTSTDDLLPDSGEAVAEVTQEGGSAIIRRSNPRSVEKARQGLQLFRNEVTKYSASITKTRKRMELIASEQVRAIKGRMEAAEKMFKALSEVMMTFDVYLGKDEVIHQLAKGAPAPADDKITIRQLTLYMDEESAIGAESGGLDYSNLATFDEWVIRPGNLRQVLPESKGIVAIKPRRESKAYGGDVFTDFEKNKANKQTYWLIRNGENIYRIISVLGVTDHIIPFDDEYEKLFESRYNRDAEGNPIRLKPGDRDYMKAMESADAQNRHYMRILLFVQGLIDRTPVFQPYPHGAERINVLDERHNEQYCRYIYDADPKKLLSHGRPEFRDWIEAVNTHLEKGVRVIGVFDTYAVNKYLRSGEDGDDFKRVHPRYAPKPKDLEIYAVERREGDDFIILYPYEKDDYRIGRHAAKNRASWRIEKGDWNVLAIDYAEVEDMEFYLTDRLNRSDYSILFPLLKTAIAMKNREAAEEAPFRKLLTGMIMARHHVTVEEAKDAVDELVPWWKYKNRTHRALKSNEKAVVNMILDEYALRRKKLDQRSSLPHGVVVAAIKAEFPNVLYVGHKTEREYVVLVPENQENIFVTEYTYAIRRDNSVVRVEEGKRWKTVDRRRWRWLDVYHAPRWTAWQHDARGEMFVTDDEMAAGLAVAHADVVKHEGKDPWTRDEEDRKRRGVSRLLAVTYTHHDQTMRAYVQTMRPLLQKIPYTGQLEEPKVVTVEYRWSRTSSGVTWRQSNYHFYGTYAHFWEQKVDDESQYQHGGGGQRRLLFSDDKAIARCDEDWRQYALCKERNGRINSMVWDVKRAAKTAIAKVIKQKAMREFLAANNQDLELWHIEEDKTKWDEKAPWDCDGTRAVQYLLARDVDANGMTLGEAMKAASKLGWSPDMDDEDQSIIRRNVERRGEKYEKPEDMTPVDVVVKYKVLPPIDDEGDKMDEYDPFHM